MTKDPAAELARRCIAATLGVDVAPWDTADRQGAYDLRYELDRRTVAVEVKRLVDPTYRQAEAAAMNAGYTRDAGLRRSWHVSLDHPSHWKTALKQLPDVLRVIEQHGWHEIPEMWRLRRVDQVLHDALAALGVDSIFSTEPTEMHPPGFYVMPAGWSGGVPDVHALPAFASRMIAGAEGDKLREQLGKADTDERHAFLFIGWEHMEAWCLSGNRDDEDQDLLPADDPLLPDPVDGLWLASNTTDTRVIAWLPGRGWTACVFATAD